MSQADSENTTTTAAAPDERNTPFGLASDMERPIWVIKGAVTTVRVLAESDVPNVEIGDARHFVAESLDGPVKSLEEKQDKLFHLLHDVSGKSAAGE
jgi:hypothetical protein